MLDPRKSPIADPVVTRLLLDVQLGRRVQQKAKYRDKQAFENAAQLERQAFRHLAAYFSARAFADVDK